MTRRSRVVVFFLLLVLLGAGEAANLMAWTPRALGEGEAVFVGSWAVTLHRELQVDGVLTSLKAEPIYEAELHVGYVENQTRIEVLVVQLGVVQGGQSVVVEESEFLEASFDLEVSRNWSYLVVGRDGAPSGMFFLNWMLIGGAGGGIVLVAAWVAPLVQRRRRDRPPRTASTPGSETRMGSSLGGDMSKGVADMTPGQSKLLDVFYAYSGQSEFTFHELAAITGCELAQVRLDLANLIRTGRLSATLAGDRLYRSSVVVVSCQLCDQKFADPVVYWQCPACKRYLCQGCHDVQAAAGCPNCRTLMVKLPVLCPACKTVYTKLDGFHEPACPNCQTPLWA